MSHSRLLQKALLWVLKAPRQGSRQATRTAEVYAPSALATFVDRVGVTH
ncbi:hypothetical protein [Nocardioides daphniae]|uniref:Uncharacterized protein n=1 Tax=Nocardioides daphniae TaxID=402297 RepID=A0ABQ1QBF1_9ACTN|nr:hypothetical protein [Nocardioides daphniae]GGD21194.1 hypothetical protein GCM10007231_20440 [Nocardioides daphniae]